MRDSGLSGKLAVVTGAARGIGAAVVAALAAEGASVVGLDIDGAGVAAVADRLTAGGARVRAATVDVRDAEAVAAAVAGIEDDWGAIEVGVNVAGVLSTTTVVDTDDAAWQRVFDVNTTGVFNLSRSLARRMMPRRRGVLVTVGSNAAGVPRHGMAAYAASKAAATLFTRCLGLELAGFGIRCNVVAPGSTRTPMQQSMWRDPTDEAGVIAGSLALFKPGIPLRRLAEPEDIADAVVFLASDRARHITMAELCVDGGASLHG
ncbi:MAG: 2,3-dihydro-2,3-dihydroxybenzoate dehydrogenase [Azospirillum sp.]|nr:2,3-dihydro-2,3-dihydroxybenzoate dehydrogenase [Azospirillum sp.]